MIAAWMAYAVLVSVALALSGRAAEWAIERGKGPIRWVWVAVVVGSVAIPAWRWSEGALFGTATPSAVNAQLVRLPQIVIAPVGEGSIGWERPAGALLLTGWGSATLFLLVRAYRQRRRLDRARATWSQHVVDGHQVLVAPEAGPAVVGGRVPSIVLPRWVLDAPIETRAMILRHEREHLLAGDAPLQSAMRLACAILPWNPVVWYAERRMRAAIEVDCDRRVLRELPGDPREYGALLLQVAGRSGQHAALAPALSESYTLIARRLTIMTRTAAPSRLLSVVVSAVALTALVAACSTEAPKVDDTIPTGVQPVGPFRITASSDTQPNPGGAYFEFQVEVPAAYVGGMRPRFPESLRAAGTEGTVLAQFIVDTSGRAELSSYKVLKTTHELFAGAVKEALPEMRFNPAHVKGRPVRQLVQAPFQFSLSK